MPVVASRPPDCSSASYKRALKHHIRTVQPQSSETGPSTPFRSAEKHYKSKFPPPDVSAALDLALRDERRKEEIEHGWWKGFTGSPDGGKEGCCVREIGLVESSARRAYTIPSLPGMVILPQFLAPSDQRCLIRTCLRDLARAPNAINLDTHYIFPSEGLWQCHLSSPSVPILPKAALPAGDSPPMENETPSSRRTLITHAPATASSLPVLLIPKPPAPPSPSVTPAFPASLLSKLRWANIGASYHWTSKSYDLSGGILQLDREVRTWCDRAVKSVRWEQVFNSTTSGDADAVKHGTAGWESWAEDYEPDAGIINFYQLSDTLMGHVDHSELDAVRPLVSISLGHACVFLLGGPTRDTPPVPVILRSGDVLIMSGPCRRAYHGVPRILEGTLPSYLWAPEPARSTGGHVEDEEEWRPYREYLATARINVNVRPPNALIPYCNGAVEAGFEGCSSARGLQYCWMQGVLGFSRTRPDPLRSSSLACPHMRIHPHHLLLVIAYTVWTTMSQTSQPVQMDHANNVYLAVTFQSSASPTPSSLLSVALPGSRSTAQPRDVALAHAGPVGSLADVQLYSMPRVEWDSLGADGRAEVVDELKKMTSVTGVQEQVLKQRVKRQEF